MATTTQAKSDTSISYDVLLELKWNPKISSDIDIAVAVKDGVVTLTGFVFGYWEKVEAEKAAKRVYGVRAVANSSTSSPEPEWGRKPSESSNCRRS